MTIQFHKVLCQLPLGYSGFPKSCCTSVNDQICHGIPDGYVLKDGDIINVDVSTILDGYYSDASRMYMIGEVSDNAKKLVEVTKECLIKGIEAVKPWTRLGNVGYTIEQLAKSNGYSVVREFGGHGIGLDFHEWPICIPLWYKRRRNAYGSRNDIYYRTNDK